MQNWYQYAISPAGSGSDEPHPEFVPQLKVMSTYEDLLELQRIAPFKYDDDVLDTITVQHLCEGNGYTHQVDFILNENDRPLSFYMCHRCCLSWVLHDVEKDPLPLLNACDTLLELDWDEKQPWPDRLTEKTDGVRMFMGTRPATAAEVRDSQLKSLQDIRDRARGQK